ASTWRAGPAAESSTSTSTSRPSASGAPSPPAPRAEPCREPHPGPVPPRRSEETMIELYSIRDVSRILAVQESRLRYWTQTGFVGPTVRKGGRFYYTFPDLVAVKAAKDLLATGMALQRVRKNVEALRRALPGDAHPTTRLRLCCDGET